MTLSVRLVRGRWVRRADGYWDHEPDLVGVNHAATLSEQTDFQNLVRVTKEKLGVRQNDEIELTYQWPQWMLGPDWRQAVPINIVDDDDTSLFMSIRVDLEEVYLRVRVIPIGTEKNVNSYVANVDFGSSSGITGNIGLDGYPGVTDVIVNPVPKIDPNDETRIPIPGYYRPILNQPLLYGYYRPISNGGIIWPGIMDPTVTGSPPLQFITVSPSNRTTFRCGSLRAPGPRHHYVPTHLYTDSARVTPGYLLGTHHYRSNFEIEGSSVRPTCGAGVEMGEGSSGGRAKLNPSKNGGIEIRSEFYEEFGIGSSGKASAWNEHAPRDLADLFRYFEGGENIGNISNLPTVQNASDVGKGEKEMNMNNKKGGDVETQLTLAGSYIAEKGVDEVNEGRAGENNSAEKILLTQPPIVSLSSTDPSSSPSTCPSTYTTTTDESEMDVDEESDNPLFGPSIRRSQFPTDGCVGRTTVGLSSLSGVAKGPSGDVANSSGNAGDKGKGVALEKRKGNAFDKGKGVATVIHTTGGNVGSAAFRGNEAPTPASEIKLLPMLNAGDAPPYIDDPINEDELDTALRDADYEGDEIYVSRIFKNVKDCRMKLAIHAINRKFHFRFAKSRPEVVLAVCVGHGCPWRVYITQMDHSVRCQVKTAVLHHTCSVDARGNFHKRASTAVIGNLMRARYTYEGRGPRAFELRRILRQEFSLHVSYYKAWRAREIALDNAMGSSMGSFALIGPYFELLLRTNPNSVVALETEIDKDGLERFKYLFFCLGACVQGYQYMRKVVVIDGTHLTGRYGGCLVAASAQDGNFQVFPLAVGIVNSENDDAWTWFFTKLTAVVPDEPDLVFVSDRHPSIFAGLQKVYPMASHAACMVHLTRNIQSIFKTPNLSYKVSQVGRAFRLGEFDRLFEEVRAANSECADYLEKLGFENWARSHFVGDRYNIMSSNVAESFNNVLTIVKDYPVISILETIRTTLVTWFALRREAESSDHSRLTPKVEEMIIEHYEKSAGYFVMKIGDGIYEVRDEMDIGYAVHLWERTCTCREFQLLHIPCKHAVAAAIQAGVQVDTLAGAVFGKDMKVLAYSSLIMPVPDMDTLKSGRTDDEGGNIAPPTVRRPPGRPRKQRILSRGEFKKVTKRRCTRCCGRGHNKSTCKVALPGP